MKKFWHPLALVSLLIFVGACSSDNGAGGSDDDDGGTTFDRSAMLQNWADNIIVPSYEDFSTKLNALKSAYDSFKSSPEASSLMTLRSAWLDTYKSWQHVSMFEIGPAETAGFRLNMNTYPTDVTTLEDHISSGSYDLKLPSNRDTKGFPALDYMLHGIAESDTDIVDKYSQDALKEANMKYVGDVIDDMLESTNKVLDGWKNGYRDTFVNNDGSSATASTDRYVNDYIFYYEKFLRAGKLGIPLGVFSGTQTPSTLESYYSPENGKTLFLEGLKAVQNFFNGKHYGSSATGESLASYLRKLNQVKDGTPLDEAINDQMDAARGKVNAVGIFRTEIENNNPATNMLSAYDAAQRVVPLFKVDMVSAMSISIDYVDADGD